MAIVQTEAQVIAIGNEVGMPDERAADVKALEATVTSEATLAAVCNEIGYYDEKAAHLIEGGITFA
jgi:hypothetical protein